MKREYRCPWCRSARVIPCGVDRHDLIVVNFMCRNCGRISPTGINRYWAMLRWERERELKLAERRGKR